ncbi:unnamed protein product, partial [marine sediment metagenome]
MRFALWLQLANGVLLALLCLRYFGDTPLPADALARIFRVLMVPAHGLLLSFAILPLVLLPALAHPGRWIVVWGALCNGALAGLVWVDLGVFALYRFHLNAMVWNLVSSGAADEILVFSSTTGVRAATWFAAMLALEGLVSWAIWRGLALRSRLGGP